MHHVGVDDGHTEQAVVIDERSLDDGRTGHEVALTHASIRRVREVVHVHDRPPLVVNHEAISLDQLKEEYYEPAARQLLGLNKEPLRDVKTLTRRAVPAGRSPAADTGQPEARSR